MRVQDAAEVGDTEEVRRLLDGGADVNARDTSEWTPLHLAASKSHVETTALLLDRGADVDAKEDVGWTPLHVAARFGHTKVGALLIERGADVNARDGGDQTPLHTAARAGETEAVNLLLDFGADARARDNGRETPSHRAGRLLGLDDVDAGGWTPLQWAESAGHDDTADALRSWRGSGSQAREQRERTKARAKPAGNPLGVVLRDRRLHIAAMVVAAVLLLAAILSSALRDREEPPDPEVVAQTTSTASESVTEADDGSPSSLGTRTGEETAVSELEGGVVDNVLLSPGTRAGEEATGPDGGTYVWVAPGEFMMGSEDRHVGENPVHKVRITKGFWLGKHEVTNGQYAAFLNAYGANTDSESHELLDVDDEDCEIEERGGRYGARAGREQHPVVEVSWYDAAKYCTHYGLRLPTEAEWEYAARGPDGRKYPWGDQWDENRCCNYDNRKAYSGADTFPIGSFPSGASWCGALDMAGNVWEWCSDWYHFDHYTNSPSTDPAGPATGSCRLLRGGSWILNDDSCRSAFRGCISPDDANCSVGFRCVRTP